MTRAGLGRREFLALTSLGSFACKARKRTGADPLPEQPRGQVLEVDEWATVEAITARILPSDDGPGAKEAKVVVFIDRQLKRDLAPFSGAVVKGARALRRWSEREHGKPFHELAPGLQDDALTRLAQGTLPLPGLPQRELFALLHTLTLEGFLGDPDYGGNADEIGWRSIGFATPTLRRPGAPHSHGGKP
jgi:gluconate 2-dehydrogenase gamma chain